MAFKSARPELEVERLDTGVSIRDQAYAALKRAIASADIYSRPDEIRIDERALCQQLGVSRTPVREAMTLLEQGAFCGRSRAAASLSYAKRAARLSR